MGRRAGLSPEETRERLLDAAASVFERKGYDAATIAEIARAADLSTGAIYANYASKAELLVEAMRVHVERATANLFPPGTDIDPAEALTALAMRLPNRDRPDTALLLDAVLVSRRDPELARVLVELLGEREAFMTAMIGAGQDAGLLTDDLPASVGARFGLMVGLGSMLIDELPLEEVDEADWGRFVERFMRAFVAASAS